MTPKEIEKLFNHPAELSAKTDGKGNEKVTLRGEVADLGWLVNKVVTGIYAQVDDPDTVRALDLLDMIASVAAGVIATDADDEGVIKRRKQYFFMTTENNLRDGNGRDKAGE